MCLEEWEYLYPPNGSCKRVHLKFLKLKLVIPCNVSKFVFIILCTDAIVSLTVCGVTILAEVVKFESLHDSLSG